MQELEYVGGGYFRQKGIPKGEVAEIIHAPTLVAQLESQLAAERQRAEQELADADLHFDEVTKQLLSALAAIEKAIAFLVRMGDLGGMGIGDESKLLSQLKSVDLSILRQHNAEVRKPLVDLLRGEKIFGEWGVAVVIPNNKEDEFYAALAQIESKQ